MSDWCPENDGAYRAEIAEKHRHGVEDRMARQAARIAELEAEVARLESGLKSIERAPRHARLADHDLVDWMASAARAALDKDRAP